MGDAPRSDPEPTPDPELETLHEVIPARAVLTELARGFLLVHESNPTRAAKFATTFLHEFAGGHPDARIESVNHVTVARLGLGRSQRGAVEPRPTGGRLL